MNYLLDSNILSEPTRRVPDPNVLRHLRDHRSKVVTATPVIHEMRYGIARLPEGGRREALRGYLNRLLSQPITVLPYDLASALWHADQRAALAATGRPPPFADGQIAAIAATNGLILVTRILADFRGFRDLRMANWFEP
jgi:tRNA(fMet)-specific endonuclease VapC